MNAKPSKRLVWGACAASLLTTACVSQSAPGVSVKKVNASLVFGVKLPTEETTPAPAEIAPPPLPDLPDLPTFNLPDFPLFLNTKTKKVGCPPAEPDAVPERVPTSTVVQGPEPGIYTFKLIRTKADKSTKTEFVREIVKGVKYIFDDNQKTVTDVLNRTPAAGAVPPSYKIQFDTVLSTGVADRFLQTTYLINPNPVNQGAPAQAGGVVNPPRAGEPERGVTIKQLALVDKSGALVPGTTPWAPQFGLTILPLPVIATEQFNTAATDPANGETYVQRANVGNDKMIIDACGDLLGAWPVTAQQTRGGTAGGANQSIINYTYAIAPQYGGLLVYQKTTEGTDTVELSIATLFPDPLPAGVK